MADEEDLVFISDNEADALASGSSANVYSPLGEMVKVKVEGERFCVPIRLFTSQSEEVKFFEASPSVTIRDPEVNPRAFGRLIKVLMTAAFSEKPLHTTEEWTDVLHLATKWKMDRVRAHAITELTQVACPVDKVELARRYGIDEWLEDAFLAIVSRKEALTYEEASQLELDDLIKLCRLREEARGSVLLMDEGRRRILVCKAFDFPVLKPEAAPVARETSQFHHARGEPSPFLTLGSVD